MKTIEKRIIKALKLAGEAFMINAKKRELDNKRCYLCKYCIKHEIFIDEGKIPIKTFFPCKKHKFDLRDPFHTYCDNFKPKNTKSHSHLTGREK